MSWLFLSLSGTIGCHLCAQMSRLCGLIEFDFVSSTGNNIAFVGWMWFDFKNDFRTSTTSLFKPFRWRRVLDDSLNLFSCGSVFLSDFFFFRGFLKKKKKQNKGLLRADKFLRGVNTSATPRVLCHCGVLPMILECEVCFSDTPRHTDWSAWFTVMMFQGAVSQPQSDFIYSHGANSV